MSALKELLDTIVDTVLEDIGIPPTPEATDKVMAGDFQDVEQAVAAMERSDRQINRSDVEALLTPADPAPEAESSAERAS